MKAHETKMEKLGYVGSKDKRHAQYKLDKVHLEREKAAHKQSGSKNDYAPNHPSAIRAHAAEESSKQMRQKIARKHEEGLSKKNDAELRAHIRDQVSPPTIHKHTVAHSHVQDNGSANSKVYDAASHADEHLAKYKNLRVKKGSGISADIVGTYHNHGHKDHGKERVIGSQIIKGSSGPHKGVAGAFKLN